ncbi:chitin deacetylase-like protein [Peziza echinospora]|nr:chitin deacetylase-like protein [Peziza echinospora]
MHPTTVILGGLACLAQMALAGPVPTFGSSLPPVPPAGTLITSCTRPGTVALTFDDGPGPEMGKLVDILNAAGAKATFFVSGAVYGCIYDRAEFVRKAFLTGHQVASHTWTHPDLTALNATTIKTEMKRTEQAIINIIGLKPTYMRPPFLATSDAMKKTIGDLGYKLVGVSTDSQDWNNLTPAESMVRIEAGGPTTPEGNGHIILMHEPLATTPTQLTPLVIQWAKKNKLKMVTVAECLGDYFPYTFGLPNFTKTCS